MSKSIKYIITLAILGLAISLPFVFASEGDGDIIDDELSKISSTLLDSSLFTQVDDNRIYDQGDVDMSDYEPVLENESLILYVNEETFSIRLLNRTTGYIWSSNLPTLGEREFNSLWLRKIDSPFYYEYYDDKNRLFEKSLLDSRRELELSMETDEENQKVTFFVDILDNQFRFNYTLYLKNNDLTVELNRESIEEYGSNRLRSISFFEFFGAAKKSEIPGYFFIPSGNGALIRFGDYSEISTRFRARFYGQDLFYTSSEANSLLSFPVFGGVHGNNQNAYLITIEEGQEYAQYNYEPTGSRADYHRQFPTFFLRESYNEYIKGSDSRLVIEKNLKDSDIRFTISVLANEDANYVGMAKKYKNYLIDGDKLKQQVYSDNLELHLEFLGSDYEEGLFMKKRFKMTTVEDILAINDELTSSGIDDIYYTLRGFNKGGNYEADYKTYKWNRRLGNVKDLSDLNVDYYYDPTIMHTDSMRSPRNVLTQIGNTVARRTNAGSDYYRYFTDIDEVFDVFPDAYKAIKGYGGMALDGLSNLYYTNKHYTRNSIMTLYEELLDEAIPMYRPNDIMLGQTSKYLNTPLNHERLRFFSDNVPFLQIVLSGYIPYYSNFLNFSANSNIDRLKAIDYGTNPSYLVTKEESHLLSKTFSRDYYATYYGNLNDHIKESYQFINGALSHVYGEEIVTRQVVSEGLVVVGYSNGVEIVINYNPIEVTYEGEKVLPQNYLVRKSVME